MKQNDEMKEHKELDQTKDNESDVTIEKIKSAPNIPEKIDKQESEKGRAKSEGPPKAREIQSVIHLTNGPVPAHTQK